MSTPKETSPAEAAIAPDLPKWKWFGWQSGIAGTVLLTLLGVGLWRMSRPKPTPPVERLRQAMELLESKHDSPKNRRLAKKIAAELQEQKYQDPDFPGAAEYILGIVAFRDGL